MIPTNPNYTKPEEKLCYVLSQLRNTGVIIETEDGMRYLKGEEFDDFFGVNDTDKALMDIVLLKNNPYTDHLAHSMAHTKALIAANILKKGFNNGTNP
jgi:hypothetical protein